MGWFFEHRLAGTSNREWFQQKFTEGHNILDMVTIKGTIFGAVQVPDGRVSAVVILTRWVRGEYHNFGYKDMDENMGPCEDECPERILALLTEPADDANAIDWRARCRARLQERKERPMVRAGDTVWFLTPLKFRNGDEQDTFIFEKRSSFVSGYMRYRISGWRDRNYEVVNRAS